MTNVIICNKVFRHTCSRSCTLLQRLVLRYQDFPGQLSLLCIEHPLLYSIVLELGSKISQVKLDPLITISLRHCLLSCAKHNLPTMTTSGGWDLSWGEASLSSVGGGFPWGEASIAPTRVKAKVAKAKMASFILKSAG